MVPSLVLVEWSDVSTDSEAKISTLDDEATSGVADHRKTDCWWVCKFQNCR